MRLIDADALLSELEKYNDLSARYRNEYLFGMQQRLETCIELVDDAPTVDAVPVRHGRWIDIDPEMYTWKIRCSKCGHERSMMSTGQIYPMYCEDCGAKMDGGDGNETD